MVPLASMTNILSDDKRQEVLALGRLGWTLRRIEQATGVRRETAGVYLKAAGLAVQLPGRWGHPPPNPAKEVSTDPTMAAASPSAPPAWPPGPQRAPTASGPLRHPVLLPPQSRSESRDPSQHWVSRVAPCS